MTENVDVDSRPRAKTSADTKKSTEVKKRALQDDTSDMEAPAAKRVRQAPDSVPLSPIAPLKQKGATYCRKNQHAIIASPTKDSSNGFDVDFDFDDIPKPKQDRLQPRAKAMKGKGGKVAPRPRPATTRKTKKQSGAKEAVQRKANVEVQDADKTLVEQAEQHEVYFFCLD